MAGALWPGCATPALQGQVNRLEKRLGEVAAVSDQTQQKQDDLENRVFLLSDQVESQKVAQNMTPRRGMPDLPVVALRPPGHPSAVGSAGPHEPADPVEFSGPALSEVPDRVRPRLPSDASLTASSDEPAALYRVAYDRLRGGHYEQAERDMREFVRRFPRHDFADNAQYWLGETFYARKTYGEAATAFRAVVARWPSGNKAPDALLKLGYSLLMLGERDKGEGVLSQVLGHYPRTDAARLAQKRLADLKEGLKDGLKDGLKEGT